MEDYLTRVWTDLIGRMTGPLTLRLFLQPAMATLFAIRDGLKDAREGRPPYFWALFTEPAHRREMLRTGWKSVAKIFIFAIILDTIYQLIVFRWLYLLETLIVAFFLALNPYLIIRGPANRIARLFKRRQPEPGSHKA